MLLSDGMFAAKLWAAYYLSYAVALIPLATDNNTILEKPIKWFQTSDHAYLATMLYATGWIANACILLGLTQVGDPLLVIAFVTFGSKLVVFLTNWTVLLLLYLLWRDEKDD